MNTIAATQTSTVSPDRMHIERAAKETEGVFLSMLLKECFAPMIESEDGGAHAGPMIEHALEQTARSIADANGIGIADVLCRQLAQEKKP